MKKKIFYLAESGKGLAYAKGNRAISKKNLKMKMISIKVNGQLMPIMVVEGVEAIEAGLELIDCITGEDVKPEDAGNYLVIVEGQHRNAAIQELKKEDELNGTSFAPEDVMVMYAQNPKGVSIMKQISECNIVSTIWDGKDYVTGAYQCNPNSELLAFAKDLSDTKASTSGAGYPLTTISKIVTFTPNLTKEVLAKSMDDGIESLPSGNVERGKLFIETAREVGFDDKFLKSRYLIEWFIDETNRKAGIKGAFEKLNGLTPEQVKAIKKVKADTFMETIRKIVG